MKRSLCLLLVAGIVFLTGCELPVKSISSETENTSTREKTLDVEEVAGSEVNDQDKEGKNIKVNQPDKPTIPVTLYYQDVDGYIIPVTRRIGKQEGIARAAVNGLIDGSINREEIEYYGLYPVLPKGTKILGLTIREGTASIDFSNQLLDYDSEKAEKSIISSIVYTLTEFHTIQKVKILVNGNSKQKLKFGTNISETLGRENILVNSGKLNLKQGVVKYDVYLFKNINEKFSYILPVSMEASSVKNDTLPSKIVTALVKKPAGETLFSQIPLGAKLINSSIKDDTLTLDFNNEITNYGGNANEEGLLNQILFSMRQIKEVSEVKLLINGKETALPEGTDLTESIKIPAVVNDYIDK